MRKWRTFTPANKIWSDDEVEYLSKHYKEDGAAKIANVLGKTPLQVRSKANVLRLSTHLEGQRRIRRDVPSSFEDRIARMLSEFGVAFATSVIVKPNFIVDFRIGLLIIEADGDWWHGHPRFQPLNERQIRQQKRDASRNAYLAACGYTVVRIWESDCTEDLLRTVLATHHAASVASRVAE